MYNDDPRAKLEKWGPGMIDFFGALAFSHSASFNINKKKLTLIRVAPPQVGARGDFRIRTPRLHSLYLHHCDELLRTLTKTH